MPMDNKNAKEKIRKGTRGFSFIKLALFLFILVSILGVSLYAFLDINPADIFVDGINGLYNRVVSVSTAKLSEKVTTLITYDINEPLSVTTVSGDLVAADKSSVRIYDSDGREKAYIPATLNKPHVQSYKNYVLVADLAGKYICLINEGKLLWEKTVDEEIVYAGLSDNWILLITKSRQSGYKRSIRAWSKDGQEVSIRNISNYYPFAVNHYPEFGNTTFVVSGVDTSGLELNGFFEFLDPTMNQKASIREEREILLKGVSLKGNLLLYGEKSLILIDEQLKTVWEKKLTGSSITAANVIDGKYPVIAELNAETLARENRCETYIRILNEDSTERKNLVIDAVVTGISTEGKTAAVQAGSEVFFINSNGEVMDSFTAKTAVSGVYLAGENLAYVVAAGEISRVNIKVSHGLLGIF